MIQFIMQAESLSYGEAVRHLAQRVNMDMPEEIDDSRLLAQKRLKERIYAANREAALFYHNILLSPSGASAQNYLAQRGVDVKTAVRFGLGYSPDEWDALYRHLLEKGFSRDEMMLAGLVAAGRKDTGRTFDFFRNRLMFPVISASGKVIAFGGRVIGNAEPKYLNTGDTPVYNKRDNIYAINLIKGAGFGDLIMVEGYMDVVSLHQSGIGNAVASLGTALTSRQAQLLKRFVPRVYYAYDGDDAGQKAMLRGVDVLMSAGVEPRVIMIPGNLDPDDYVRRFGADGFIALKDSSITATRFKIERIAAESGLDSPDGRESFARRACALLAKLEPVERERYVGVIAEMSGLPVITIKQQCNIRSVGDYEPTNTFRRLGYRSPRSDSAREKSERMLAACIMKSTAAAQAVRRLPDFSLDIFTDASLRSFCAKLFDEQRRLEDVDIGLLIAELAESGSADSPSAAYQLCGDIIEPLQTASDIIRQLKHSDTDARIRELQEAIVSEQDTDKREELNRELVRLMRDLGKRSG